MHQLLPPTYRDVWLEWRDSDQQKQEESRTAANKPRDQFISRLLTRLKQQQNQNQEQESTSQGQVGQGGDADEEPEESWENLAGLDIGEGGDNLEDKSEKRGVRKEGAAALEASRELLKKLKNSSVAHKLKVDILRWFHLKDTQTDSEYLNRYLSFKAEREQLPVFQHRHRVLEALQRHRVVVVAGETGSGKSTQIPQFLLEELLTGGKEAQPCNIVVTQPRRISAMSLACRVSQELGCEDGPGSKVKYIFNKTSQFLMYLYVCLCDIVGWKDTLWPALMIMFHVEISFQSSLCGYQIRMENQSGEWTRLLYCTTGVLLRKLQHDKHLSSLTHIIVDEVQAVSWWTGRRFHALDSHQLNFQMISSTPKPYCCI